MGWTICKCREEKSTRRLTSQRAPGAEREYEGHAEDGLGAAHRSIICAKAATGAPVIVIDYR